MLPDIWLQHTGTVWPRTGTGAYGEIFGPPVAIEGLCEDVRRMVRDADGAETVSESTFYADPVDVPIPPLSRIQLPSGRETRVIRAAVHGGGDLPLPSHLEIVCE